MIGRLIWPLLFLASVHSAAAQSTTDDALARYRTMMSGAAPACAKVTDPNEILVCARSKLRESQKVPFIEETRRGDRPRLAPGEVPSGVPGKSCGPRGEGCYEGPGLSGTVKALIAKIKGD